MVSPLALALSRSLAAAARRVTAVTARIAGITAARAAVTGILEEADVLVAFRFVATVLDLAATTPRELAGLCVDHAAASAAISAAIGEATATIDSLAVATAARVASARGHRRDRRRGHGDAGDSQNGRP